MAPESITGIETRLRSSVCAGRFADVADMLPSYCAAVEALAKQLPAGDPRLAELASRFDALAVWIRLMLSVGRAQCAGELQRFGHIQGYFGPVSGNGGFGTEG